MMELTQHLIEGCLKGDRKAQFTLFNQYGKAMYNVCYRLLKNEDDAADALQEAFVDAFQHLHTYRKESSFGYWLKQIVIHKSISALRKRKNEALSWPEGLDLSEEWEEELDTEAQVDQIKKKIDQLPDGYRIVLTLYLIEGYDHEEIAQILQISENTSRTQLHRGKKKLLERLAS
jgi:RNA polymerase sigma factor (sigma-70 family)